MYTLEKYLFDDISMTLNFFITHEKLILEKP